MAVRADDRTRHTAGDIAAERDREHHVLAADAAFFFRRGEGDNQSRGGRMAGDGVMDVIEVILMDCCAVRERCVIRRQPDAAGADQGAKRRPAPLHYERRYRAHVSGAGA